VLIWRSTALALAALWFAAGAEALAAAGEDPDWPCVQRLVPEIAAGMIWAGPPLDSVDGGPSPTIDRSAAELAARRVSLEEAEAQIDALAETMDAAQKSDQLTRLFARTLEIINRDRTSIIGGIKKYARSERALARAIAEKNARLAALPADRIVERQTLTAERDWDLRIYDDRQRSLTYLCEQPVLLEQRAFALARAIAGHLD
jgi:septal ring factor EnvC (AmiA/AmiB activator)